MIYFPSQTLNFFLKEITPPHEDWIDAISSVSDNLICVSKSVADELISYLKSQNKLREDLNITYIHNGADIENSVPTKGLPQDHERVLERDLSIILCLITKSPVEYL